MATSSRRPARAVHAGRPRVVRASFDAPTAAQAQGWAAIARGEHTLICAPTGSGKTLAAFLWCLDRLAGDRPRRPTSAAPATPRPVRLAAQGADHDVERNLRAPLAGIGLAAAAPGRAAAARSRVAIRTGDTPAEERREIARHPPDILITTPESLYLMLTSQAREILRGVERVIVDEIHAIAGTKRGAHLALSPGAAGAPGAERGAAAAHRAVARRSGRSTTIAPLPRRRRARTATVTHRRCRHPQAAGAPGHRARRGHEPPRRGPAARASSPAARRSARRHARSIWPSIYPRILELIRAHRSTIVFINSRRLAERLAQRLNELAGEELVRAHHGSIAREQRLRSRRSSRPAGCPALVATSQLELGIDMGAVDLVIQVGVAAVASPAGCSGSGGPATRSASRRKGIIFPKYRGDLLEAAVVTGACTRARSSRRASRATRWTCSRSRSSRCASMDRGRSTSCSRRSRRRRAVRRRWAARRSKASWACSPAQYPSDEFAELKPRLVWDRVDGHDRRAAAMRASWPSPAAARSRTAACSACSWSGEAGDAGRRVGELDEEMVYESRAGRGDVSSWARARWRIEEIEPRPGHRHARARRAGQDPVLEGRRRRPADRARARARRLRRRDRGDLARGARAARRRARGCTSTTTSTTRAADNLLAYLEEEREATGALPTDQRIVVERFRDELGDWRLRCSPRSVAASTRRGRWRSRRASRERLGLEVQTIWSDDGIAIRLPEGDGSSTASRSCCSRPPRTSRTWSSARSATRRCSRAVSARTRPAHCFCRVAGRARGRRCGSSASVRPTCWPSPAATAGSRSSSRPTASASRTSSTCRRCATSSRGVASREIAIHGGRDAASESPFASSLLFDYVAAYMYEGDAPLAERRAGALTLDRDLLRELLGQEELRELLDPDALAELELALQALTEERRATTVDQVHDLLRRLGDLSTATRSPARVEGGAAAGDAWLASCSAAAARGHGPDRRRASAGSRSRTSPVTATASASPPPGGVPEAFLAPGGRRARRAAGALGADPRAVPDARARRALGSAGRRRRRRAGAAARRGHAAPRRVPAGRRGARVVRPRGPASAPPPVAGAPATRGRAGRSGGPRPVPARLARRRAGRRRPAPFRGSAALERLAEVVDQLAGCRIPASVLERDMLPARVPGYQPRLLDELGAMGEVAWVGRGASAATTGAMALYRRVARSLRPRRRRRDGDGRAPPGRATSAIREHLAAARRVASIREPSTRRRAAAPTARCSMRSGTWSGPARSPTTRSRRCGRCAGSGPRPAAPRRRPGRLTALGPPEAAGRWSLVEPVDDTPADRAAPRPGLALLERHGVRDPRGRRRPKASRRLLRGVSGPARARGGRPDPARLLRRRPRRRPVRAAPARSTGCARSATPRSGPGATRGPRAGRRRSRPTHTAPRSLAASRRRRRRPFQRAAGAYVVLVDGVAALYLERGGRSLQTLPAADDPDVATRRGARARRPRRRRPFPRDGRSRKVDGEPVARRRRSRERLLEAGFTAGLSRPASCAPRASAATARPVPEGDTLFRTGARGLPPRTSSAPGRRPRRGPHGPAARPAGRADHRRSGSRGGGAGQEPADPVRQRPRAPDPPPDERLVAPLPARRALAPPAGAGPARPRGPGRGRRLLRRAGRRAVRDAGRGRSIRRSRGSGPTCSRPTSTATEAHRRLRDTGAGRR